MMKNADRIDFGPRAELLYYFCRLQLPTVALAAAQCDQHLQRSFLLFRGKEGGADVAPETYLDNLYPLDWYVAVACLEGSEAAWENLFAARAGRSDCLLMDALRARAARLYPRDEERQENAVTEFWGYLVAAENDTSLPILARYDGQRPLVPWLIRVFQNWHISKLRRQPNLQSFPEDDIALPLPAKEESRWHEPFCDAARAWLSELDEGELLLLGLRLRYRMSQREVATLLKVHEGTISRRTDALREQCLESISKHLRELGWSGDDLSELVRTEMHGVLLDDPKLSVDNLARILPSPSSTSSGGKRAGGERKKKLPSK